jgi:predicted nucleotidyltransferase component of viral defense system
MFKDPIVEEVRAIRQRHAARFGYDLWKIAEDFRKSQAESGRPVASYLPKPPDAKRDNS